MLVLGPPILGSRLMMFCSMPIPPTLLKTRDPAQWMFLTAPLNLPQQMEIL